MIELVYYLTNLLFFYVPLLYYYINLRLSIIVSLSYGDIYFFRYFFIMFICSSFWIILWWSFLYFCKFISNFITDLPLLLFELLFLKKLFSGSVDVSVIKKFFSCIYHLNFYLYFREYFFLIFLAKDKNP